MPTFDVVSKLEHHEIDNAVNQAQKEVATRYDFRDTGTEITRGEDGIRIAGNSQQRVDAARAVLEEKLAKRRVALTSLDPQAMVPGGGGIFRQLVKLKEGLTPEKAKEVVRTIKDSKLKVQGSIQGDLVRVSGKKKDDLQEAIAFLRSKDFEQPLQYVNFRD